MIKVAKIAIKNKDKYLLLKRKMNSKFFSGLWDFPGGKLDLDELPLDCVIRETKEETDLNLNSQDIKIIKEGEHIENNNLIYYALFETSKYNGQIKLSPDHIDFKWFTKKEVFKLDRMPFIEKYFI
jgi:8-oxo-dGTP pyrophosphatase MutT (NUDIX family)